MIRDAIRTGAGNIHIKAGSKQTGEVEIRLKKKIILLNLKLKVMKSSNIWKIVIGAVSAALGYILNAIGL